MFLYPIPALVAVCGWLFVLVTTGLPVADPWAVSVLRVREDGTGSVPDGLVRPQPVFDGIVVFARRDGSAWEPGPYRFAFARPDGPVALDVCLGD